MAELMQFRKKNAVIEAIQWFKNGDHPYDRVGEQEVDFVALYNLDPTLPDFFNDSSDVNKVPDNAPTYTRLEGAIVRFFRHPNYMFAGERVHEGPEGCGRAYRDHGWIDCPNSCEGGHTVCPGNWLITDPNNEIYSIKPDVFFTIYEPVKE